MPLRRRLARACISTGDAAAAIALLTGRFLRLQSAYCSPWLRVKQRRHMQRAAKLDWLWTRNISDSPHHPTRAVILHFY
jgi:hypothetical protein